MRQIYNSVFNFTKRASLLVLIGVSFITMNTQAQEVFKADSDSKIAIALDSNYQMIDGIRDAISASGNFVIKNGELEDINSFTLSIPSKSNAANDTETAPQIEFTLTHVMILPTMKMVHVIGLLNINGVSTRTDLGFKFLINPNQTISLTGIKNIKLKDYQESGTGLAARFAKNEQLKLDLNLVFKAEQYTAALPIETMQAHVDSYLSPSSAR